MMDQAEVAGRESPLRSRHASSKTPCRRIVWQNHFRKRPLSAEVDQGDEPREVVRVLQGPVRRRRRLRLRVRGQLRSWPPSGPSSPATWPRCRPTGRKESWKDTGITHGRAASSRSSSRKGLEPQSRVRVVFSGPFTWDPTQRDAAPRARADSRGAARRGAARGPVGDLRREGDLGQRPRPEAVLRPVDRLQLRARADRRTREAALPGNRRGCGWTALGERTSAASAKRWCASSRPTRRENRWATARITEAFENGDDPSGRC